MILTDRTWKKELEMKIELYSAQKLSLKGSDLQKMIQNKDMPILDLLVRESIQNSLDAKDDSSPSRFVTVEFNYGDFNRDALNSELEGINLYNKPLWGNRYLSISDKNTVGLTGKYDDKKSNLYKLVFGIMDAQQTSGAGGSWGIGKTVYFRVGVGLVIYYSRIKTDSGDYESLLSAAFVEDETSETALIPSVNGQKYGIAWWGDEISPNSHTIRETRDQKSIDRLLQAFNLAPYKGPETGTRIIIPFIDEQFLLSHNQPAREDDMPAPFWMSSLKEYLRISAQRWYIARLNNRKYLHGKYLNLSINGKPIGPDSVEPFFLLAQTLYNKAALSIAKSPDSDNIKYADTEIKTAKIVVYSQISPNEAGQVAYVKVNRKQLGMTPPENRPSPYEYINSSVEEDSFGKPILMFCRKPGMVVSYKTYGKWLEAVPKTSDDEFIIAWFVLNSQPKLTSADITIEDYIRKSEMADHCSWDDCALDSQKPSIISKIKRSVSRKLGEAFEDAKDNGDKTADTGLGTLLGRLLLPPEGFGGRPTNPQPIPPGPSPDESGDPGHGGVGGGGSSTTIRNCVKYKYSIVKYTPTGMLLQMTISTGKKKATRFGFSFEMDSIKGSISAKNWKNDLGLLLPFCISTAKMTIKKVDEDYKEAVWTIHGDAQYGIIQVDLEKTSDGEWYGIEFGFADGEGHAVELLLFLDVAIHRKDINPVLSFE